MKIPFFALDRQYMRDRDTYRDIADKVWRTGRVLQGPEVEEFETAVAAAMGRELGVAVGSCTDALAFALMANDIGSGDEVLVTCYSFVASVSPIFRVGATPRFVDIDPDTFMMDMGALKAAITPATKAILAVHLFGQTLDMAAVEDIAARHNLVLIEDAAQAIGAHDETRPGGSMGRISCVSFDPTKNIGSYSSAGAIATDDSDMATAIRRLRYHGRDDATRQNVVLGYNSQLASDMAGMLTFKLSKLDQWTQERLYVASRFADGLANVSEISLPVTRAGSTHTYHKFVMRADDRDALGAFLGERGIATMKHYNTLLCDVPFVRERVGVIDGLVNARKAASEVLSLPIFQEMTMDEADYIVDAVKAFYTD
ncbi:MAG: DegT/DnrJ/EryC1/StrS family aminotransferase [Rhodospirillales bacterium]|jgi:dTDP-4-amino-4,6-dideoxygalactose transaminase